MNALGMTSPMLACKHKSHPKKCFEDAIAGDHEYIKSTHHYHSHYSRVQNPHETFNLELTVFTLYNDCCLL
jgi:hypothetical protein